MNLSQKVLCILLALTLVSICVACKQDISDANVFTSEETTIRAGVDDPDNKPNVISESPDKANGNGQAVNETATSPFPESVASTQPPGVEQTTAIEQTAPTGRQESMPTDIVDNSPASAQETDPEAPSSTSPTTTPAQETTPETPSATSPTTTPTPIPTPSPASTPTDDEPIVLLIRGDGVSEETTFTLKQLQSMQEGYREYTYSTTNNWPSYGHTAAHGISLPYILQQAGMLSSAVSFKFLAADGYHFTVTYNQVFGTRYSYADHSPTGSSGASIVEPVVAWEFGEVGRVRAENLRVFFGQSGPQEVNTSAFVSDLVLIEISTAPPGAWSVPVASIADGNAIPAGAELSLMHDSMDSIRIYYTLDGSEPDFNSLVYNRSASYFQPQLIVPLILTEDTTVKAFAAGLGKDPSQVVTFNYIINDLQF